MYAYAHILSTLQITHINKYIHACIHGIYTIHTNMIFDQLVRANDTLCTKGG